MTIVSTTSIILLLVVLVVVVLLVGPSMGVLVGVFLLLLFQC